MKLLLPVTLLTTIALSAMDSDRPTAPAPEQTTSQGGELSVTDQIDQLFSSSEEMPNLEEMNLEEMLSLEEIPSLEEIDLVTRATPELGRHQTTTELQGVPVAGDREDLMAFLEARNNEQNTPDRSLVELLRTQNITKILSMPHIMATHIMATHDRYIPEPGRYEDEDVRRIMPAFARQQAGPPERIELDTIPVPSVERSHLDAAIEASIERTIAAQPQYAIMLAMMQREEHRQHDYSGFLATSGPIDFFTQAVQPRPATPQNTPSPQPPRQYIHKEIEADEQCGVCLDELTDNIVCIDPCDHHYHQACISRWQKEGRSNSKKCPNCREKIEKLISTMR